MALAQWTDAQILAQLSTGARWSGDVITYSMPTTASGLRAGEGEDDGFSPLGAAAQTAAELALRLWDDLIAPDFVRTSVESFYRSADIEFGMSSTQDSYAHAYYPSVGSVWFKSTYTTGTNNLVSPTVGRHGFATYIHEIGHALGLDHMGEYDGSGDWTPSSYQDSSVYSVMSYFGPSWGTGEKKGEGLVAWADWYGADGIRYSPQTPMISDIFAIQAIYGVETTTRTGDTVYGFNSNLTDATRAIYDFGQNKNPILAIFDSTGVDTLDLSGWSTASVINLAPGSFSSCNAMTDNISIAYGCEIENAVGGAGADKISGNALGNRLTGGAGDDTIYALSGDDIIVAGLGNDTVDGGDGIDYAHLEEDWSSISYSVNTANGSVEFKSQSHGVDKYVGVEFFVDAQNVIKSLAEIRGETVPASSTTTPSGGVSNATPSAGAWRLLAETGFAGEVGGSGMVFGTSGRQEITVLDLPGTVAFDPSFNAGGDLIGLAGPAGAWRIVLTGSTALLSDGDTFVTIPVGTAGTTIAFADGQRILAFDSAANVVRLGDQALTGAYTPVTAAGTASLPNAGVLPDAAARLFLSEGGTATVGGHVAVFGANGDETIAVTYGTVSLDPSFNRGGDTLVLGEAVGSFTAARSGSTVRLHGADTDITVPVGIDGLNVHFSDADEVIRYDANLDALLIGSQPIGSTATVLTDFA